MAYPDKVLAPDEAVVAHLHPHAGAVLWPVARMLVVVGAASFGMAAVPAGRDQGVHRLALLAVAALLLLVWGLLPLLRWRTTHLVVTTHRLLHRTGLLTRRGRDVPLVQIADVSFAQTLGQRLLRAGTLRVASVGEGALVVPRVPGVERVQTLLHHMVEEDADRRAQGSAAHPSDGYGYGAGSWGSGGWGSGVAAGWGSDGEHIAGHRTHPVP